MLESMEPSTSGPDAGTSKLRRAPSMHDFWVWGVLGEGAFGRVMMAMAKDTQQVCTPPLPQQPHPARRGGPLGTLGHVGRPGLVPAPVSVPRCLGEPLIPFCCSTLQMFAMKAISKKQLLLQGRRTVKRAITENMAMQEMAKRPPHPYTARLLCSFQDTHHLFFVMEYVGGGDLFSLIERKRLPESWALLYTAEMVSALEFLHSCGYIHRDLKPENIMVAMDGHLKLIDFGMAKPIGGGGADRGSICGTPEYTAPEILQGRPHGYAADWWALGCLAYEMMVGFSPFSTDNLAQTVQCVLREGVDFPQWLLGELRDLISSLLNKASAPPSLAPSLACSPSYFSTSPSLRPVAAPPPPITRV